MSIKNLFTNVVKEYQTLNVNSIDFENSNAFINTYTGDAKFSVDEILIETIPDGLTYHQLGDDLTIIRIGGFEITTPNTSPQENIVCHIEIPPQRYLATKSQILGSFQFEDVSSGEYHLGYVQYIANQPDATYFLRRYNDVDWAQNTHYKTSSQIFLKMECS